MITNISDLIKILETRPNKIILVSSLCDWLLKSSWDCVLSDKLKDYIKNGGIVERIGGNKYENNT